MSYLAATDLARSYVVGRRRLFRKAKSFFAVDGVSLTLERGKTLGVVGESGCGKSTLAKLILGLIAADRGEITLDGDTLDGAENAAWRARRRKMQLVYQDAAGALDPRMPVRAQVAEPLKIHGLPPEAAEHVLEAVGMSGRMADRYPHELSGGQLQRVVIARALALGPELLVLDEPVSALDVSIQAQIVNLLMDLQHEFALTYLFVSHDLGVIRHVSDRIAVMYLGQIVEEAPKDALFERPHHPYTQALMAAVPDPDPTRPRTAPSIGDPPNPADPPMGCRFHPRCPLVEKRCRTEAPALRSADGRSAACHIVRFT